MAYANKFPNHKRIKPKPSMKNKDTKVMKKSVAVSDPDFILWLHEVKKPKCFCCGREYYFEGIQDHSEVHHIKEASTDHKNDREVLMLCGVSCHRLGTELSAHGTPKKFREKFPIKEQKIYSLTLYLEYLDYKDKQ